MDERVARLRAELNEADKAFAALASSDDATWQSKQDALERCHELERELKEAEGVSLLGDGSPRL